ncbi:hypothetical protein F5883DRAFT_616785 [Diaporthe sp. PMI_573]|nr:hypothetical protein F5883DRAFT_616785 [Diaporthaceae sp. PMI_573]
MNTSQIYHIPNWETQDEQQWATVVNRLGASSPYHVREEKGALSGVDCMIRIIQQVLCSLNRKDSQHLLREHRMHNFLLDLAVRDFTGNTPIQRENTQNARDVFWGVLCRQKMGTSGTPSFLEIDQSALMQGTLWGWPDLQAFHESSVRPRGSIEFQRLDKLQEHPNDLDAMRTSRSRFTWDTSLHKNLKDMFGAHFGQALLDGAHGTYTFYSKAPKIARILFDPTKTRIEGLAISSLYRMRLVTKHMTCKRRDGEEDGSDWVYSSDRAITYSLIAVVRLRKSQHEHDYVRLYDAHGHPAVPRGPAEEFTSHHSREWSVSDQDHQYMLYYAPIADPWMSVQRPSCVEPPPSSPVEGVTDAPQPMRAPQVSQTASEVAPRRKQPQPGRKTTQELFGSWAAAHRVGLERRLAGEKQAGRSGPPTHAQGQAATSSAQPGSSRPSGPVSLPGGAGHSSSATLPSSAHRQPVSTAGPADQSGPSSSTLPPNPHSQHDKPGVRDVPAGGKNTDEDAAKTQAARSRGQEPHKPVKRRESSSTSTSKYSPFYSSSFEG